MASTRVENMLNLPQIFADKSLCRYVPCGAPDSRRLSTVATALFTNCYTGALGIPMHGIGRPGFLKEKALYNRSQPHERTRNVIHAGLIADGLEKIDYRDVDKHGISLDMHVIAGFIDEGRDYHFFTLASDGDWYEKCPHGPLLPKFNVGKSVLALSTGYYPDFIGAFAIPKEGIEYYPRLEIPKLELS